jgi:hypothetical protein
MRSLYLLLFALYGALGTAASAEDMRSAVKEAYRERIGEFTTGFYCKALSCEFDIEWFALRRIAESTFEFETTAWLKGTIPGLRGSAKRTVNLKGTYTRGTCILKDVRAISDTIEDNNGWGASRVASIFKSAPIPPHLVMEPDDCRKADVYLQRMPG